MAYSVKEIYYTLQGEGQNSGRPAVLCRFTGCNLWSGHERHRATAICSFCDTDFVGRDGPGGGRFAGPAELAAAIAEHWPGGGSPLIVFTGGEPLLQVDADLLHDVHALGFEAAVETNGTIVAPEGLDWICVSPKSGAQLRQRSGDELKLVYPQDALAPEDVEGLEFTHFFLQPLDGPDLRKNTESAVRYCLEHPRWKLSVQVHKFVGLP